MFEKITKKFVNQAKETAKDEFGKSIKKYIPAILKAAVVYAAIMSIFEQQNNEIEKKSKEMITIINNYYIYGGIQK
jgi:adenylate kinase